MKLRKSEKEDLIKKLKNDDYLDEKYKNILFKDKKEYKLINYSIYRESDILSDNMDDSFQKVRYIVNIKFIGFIPSCHYSFLQLLCYYHL
ncbi:MAG TPA: hypothetical protein VIK14_03700 [Ignavibacteria bacterium]